METLHYPGAGERRKNIQERLEQQRQQTMMAAAEEPAEANSSMPSEADIEEMARQAAMADAADQAAGASAARSMGLA